MSPFVAFLVASFLGVVAGHGPDYRRCHANLTVTADECCKIPMLVNRTVLDRCRKQSPFRHGLGRGGKEDQAKARQAGECMAQCVLAALGGFQGEQLDAAGFKRSVQQALKAPQPADMAQLVRQSIDECTELANLDPAFSKSVPAPPGGKTPACSAVPKLFMNCLYAKVFTKCPSGVWNDRKECTALKDKLAEGCPYFALRRHPKREN